MKTNDTNDLRTRANGAIARAQAVVAALLAKGATVDLADLTVKLEALTRDDDGSSLYPSILGDD